MAATIAELQAKARADAGKLQNATYLKTQLTRATERIQVRHAACVSCSGCTRVLRREHSIKQQPCFSSSITDCLAAHDFVSETVHSVHRQTAPEVATLPCAGA